MNYKSISFTKKPLTNDITKQLFAFDVCKTGAKNFLFDTYESIYDIIKKKQSHFYEDNTYSSGIKLFIDIDDKTKFTTELLRDKYADKLIELTIPKINTKLLHSFNINNTPIIILISDTLDKASLHFIYPNIVFNNIDEMKYFMNDTTLNTIETLDQSVYKTGCFRMMYCSKFGKFNKLIYYNSFNYDKSTDYNLFLDSCICYISDKPKVSIEIADKSIIKKSRVTKLNNKIVTRNYIYKHINYNKLQSALNKIKDKLLDITNNYSDWFKVAVCMKDLYLSSRDQTKIYDLFDKFSEALPKYNKIENKKI